MLDTLSFMRINEELYMSLEDESNDDLRTYRPGLFPGLTVDEDGIYSEDLRQKEK